MKNLREELLEKEEKQRESYVSDDGFVVSDHSEGSWDVSAEGGDNGNSVARGGEPDREGGNICGDTLVAFGMHTGKAYSEVYSQHPRYCNWVYNKYSSSMPSEGGAINGG